MEKRTIRVPFLSNALLDSYTRFPAFVQTQSAPTKGLNGRWKHPVSGQEFIGGKEQLVGSAPARRAGGNHLDFTAFR
jgi:hypothetical protein